MSDPSPSNTNTRVRDDTYKKKNLQLDRLNQVAQMQPVCRFQHFLCYNITTCLTWMLGHVLLQFSPGVFNHLAISVRAAVTCGSQTGAVNVARNRAPSKYFFFSLLGKHLQDFSLQRHKKGYKGTVTSSILSRQDPLPGFLIDQPACFFSWALRATWESNVAAHPSFTHLSTSQRRSKKKHKTTPTQSVITHPSSAPA